MLNYLWSEPFPDCSMWWTLDIHGPDPIDLDTWTPGFLPHKNLYLITFLIAFFAIKIFLNQIILALLGLLTNPPHTRSCRIVSLLNLLKNPGYSTGNTMIDGWKLVMWLSWNSYMVLSIPQTIMFCLYLSVKHKFNFIISTITYSSC